MDESLGQSDGANSMTSHPLDSLILPQRTSQRILIEELPEEGHNTKTDTQKSETDPKDNPQLLPEDSRESKDNPRATTDDARLLTEVTHEPIVDGRTPNEDTQLATKGARVTTEDSRVSADNFRRSTEDSDSGISIDIIQKLAEEVGSTIMEREPLNIEQTLNQFKEKSVVEFEDVDE